MSNLFLFFLNDGARANWHLGWKKGILTVASWDDESFCCFFLLLALDLSCRVLKALGNTARCKACESKRLNGRERRRDVRFLRVLPYHSTKVDRSEPKDTMSWHEFISVRNGLELAERLIVIDCTTHCCNLFRMFSCKMGQWQVRVKRCCWAKIRPRQRQDTNTSKIWNKTPKWVSVTRFVLQWRWRYEAPPWLFRV